MGLFRASRVYPLLDLVLHHSLDIARDYECFNSDVGVGCHGYACV
jgi:hypothetical protein